MLANETGIRHLLGDVMSFLGVNSLPDVIRVVVDISIVAYVIYRVFMLVRDTRAMQLVKGILVILIAMYVSKWLGLHTIEYLLTNSIQLIGFTLVVIFQPELRRGLEQIGRSRVRDFINIEHPGENSAVMAMVEEITKACAEMAKNYTGALIVIERKTRLGEIVVKGTELDAKVTSELLLNIFTPNTPLHDGAVMIEENRVKAAACILPLSENPELGRELGTRHRAAIGVTEVSDAICVVVSEQSGRMSFVINGTIRRNITVEDLRDALHGHLVGAERDGQGKWSFWKSRSRNGKVKTDGDHPKQDNH